MKMQRLTVIFPATLVVGVSFLVFGHGGKATPWGTAAVAPVATAKADGIAASADRTALSIPDTTAAINSDKPMSERIVHYEIAEKYDASSHTVNATEVLTYHNLTGQALDHFPFHLYQNAFQPKATFVREAKLEGSRDTAYAKWEDKDYGSEDIRHIFVLRTGDQGGDVDMTNDLKYIQPDGGKKGDSSGEELPMRRPIAPDAYVRFKIMFRTQFPE